MGSVYEEISRLETAKSDIETAIETCGVNVPNTELIDTYASYIRQIPSAVFSELNVDTIGGSDKFIQSIKQTNGKIEATVGGLVSSSDSGLVPKIGSIAAATITTSADEWVLTSTKGAQPTWRKLPTNAFKNDTYTFTGGNGSFTVTPSGGTAQIVSIGKPATAGTADKLICEAGTDNSFRHVWFSYNGQDGRLVYDDDFTYNPATNVLKVGSITGSADWANITNKPTLFTPSSHNHPSSQINALTNYAKATTAADLATTDTLNAALGKLEYKADLGVTAYNLVNAAYDGDGTIENLKEILKVLEGISDTDTIQAIIGKYLPLSGGTMNGSIKFNSSSLPGKTLQYICGVDAFGNGGEMGWMQGSTFVNQYAPTKTGGGASGTWGINITGNADTLDNKHASDFALLKSVNNLIHNTNEFTFVSKEYTGYVLLNYRTASGYTDGSITGYKFCNGHGGELAYISQGYFSGKSESAKSVPWSGITNKPTSFAPSEHTHNYLPLSGGTINGDLAATGKVTLLSEAKLKIWDVTSSRNQILGKEMVFIQTSIDGADPETSWPDKNRNDLFLQPKGGHVHIGPIEIAQDYTCYIAGTLKVTDTITASTFNGNAATATTATTATKLQTAKTISLNEGVTGLARSFDGTANITIPVTEVKEAYLSWGGKNLVNSFGPIDAALIPNLGSNRLAFMPPKAIEIEYSRDGGITWNDYGATDEQKLNIFCGLETSIRIGKSEDTGIDKSNYQVRIIITADRANVYTSLCKFIIKASTQGSSGCWCTIDAKNKGNLDAGNDTWTVLVDKQPINGWPAYNVINISGNTIIGNYSSDHFNKLRFTFGVTSHPSTMKYLGFIVNQIQGFGGVGWGTPSNMAKYGSIYSYDFHQNALFPSKIYATHFIKRGSSNSYVLLGDGNHKAESSLSVAKATQLTYYRTIWGQSFNGTANISGALTNTGTITPSSTHTYNIGSSSLVYEKVYTRYIDTDSTYYLRFAVEGVERMIITTSGDIGIGTTNPSYKLHVAGQVASSGFVKSGSSDSYILLGNGGHKAISDFMLKSEVANQELNNNLTTITKSLTVTADWMDTGISSTNIPTTGTYIVQVSVNNTTDNMSYCYWSGIMSWYASSTNDVDTDEIILHRSGHNYGNTIYLRTVMQSNSVLKLQIAANKTLSTAATYTFKFKRVI